MSVNENDNKKEQARLLGSNEITEKLKLPDTYRSNHVVVQKVTATAHLGCVPCGTSDDSRLQKGCRPMTA